jgi:hypothetical protein
MLLVAVKHKFFKMFAQEKLSCHKNLKRLTLFTGWYTLRSALAKRATGRRHECRRGTQECVRHMWLAPNRLTYLGPINNPQSYSQPLFVPYGRLVPTVSIS